MTKSQAANTLCTFIIEDAAEFQPEVSENEDGSYLSFLKKIYLWGGGTEEEGERES